MVPPKPAASAHPPRRNHHVFSQLQPFTETRQVQARPDQLGSGGRQGWPLLCREPPPGVGLSVAASAGPGCWGRASPRGPPSGQGLQVLSNGPDLRYFPHPFSTATCPRGFLRGLQCYILTPTFPCWQGQGSRGTGSAIWDPQKVWGSDFKLIAPPSCSLHNEPHTRAAQSTWQGAWWSGLQPRSLQGPPPSLPAGTPVCCPMHAPEGPEVVHA